jgi:hypothetical protein
MPSSFKNQTIIIRRKMKKVILALASVVLLIGTTQTVHAQDQRVLAIIDTAIDSSKHPSVIYEACLTLPTSTGTSSTGCPNGKTFMEGPGSAGTPVWPTSMVTTGTYHGDAMVKSALVVNPNIKIVFVRYSDISRTTGNSVNTQEALVKAIEWVSNNAEKYSIDAVSISQSSISSGNLSRCSTDKVTANAVSSLNAKNIPTFAATGNDGSLTVIGYPSCVPGVTATAALASDSVFEKASNRGPGVDLVAIGKTSITRYNGSETDIFGTSSATVKSAATFVGKNTTTSFAEYLGSLSKAVVLTVSYPFGSR